MEDGYFEADPALMPLGKLVTWTGQALNRFYQRTVAAHGLTTTSIGILGVLAAADAMSHRELAAHLGVAPATLTPVVDGLQSAGALSRVRDRSDRRVVRLSITPPGRERLMVALADVTMTVRERMPRADPQDESIVRAYLLGVLAAVVDDGANP